MQEIVKRNAMIRARTSTKLKKEAEQIFRQLGMNCSEAINLFYTQVSLRRGLPFAVEIPKAKTLATFSKKNIGKKIVKAKKK